MNLQTWCSAERGRASVLAAAIGVPPSFMSQMVGGTRPIPAEHCPAIERATAGAVRCEDLRPDVAWDVLRGVSSTQPTPEPQPAAA